MLRWIGVGTAGAAMMLAALACSSTSSNASAEANGCDELYTKYFARCELANYPASEVTRLQARWDTYCGSLTSLPGFGATGAELEQCAAAYATADCSGEVTPAACTSLNAGTLAAGASCIDGSQCQSGSCDDSLPDGGTTVSGCGTCDALVAIGGSCSGPGTTCGPNATCNQGTTGASTCTANSTIDGGATTFTTIAEGGACNVPNSDAFCAPGLACGPANTCVVPTFVEAGQPCDLLTKVCLVGQCNGASEEPSPDGGITSTQGTCPTIIPDGQPCTSSGAATCDTFASCVNGVCQLTETASTCK